MQCFQSNSLLLLQIQNSNINRAVYAQLPIHAETEGPIALAGPADMTAEGGSTGLYIKTTGERGSASLTLSAPGLKPVTISFAVQ